MNAAADIPAAYLLWYENGSDRGAIFILPGDPWVMRVFRLDVGSPLIVLKSLTIYPFFRCDVYYYS